MKFQKKHLGKWVAAKDETIIADAKSLNLLMRKVQKRKDPQNLKFILVPKGYIAGQFE